jgi:predicted AAA+ superfamily ATPase
MESIKRLLEMALPLGRSAFLWGARKTGKSTYLRERFPQSLVFDFLDTDLVLEFSKRPALLRDQLLAQDATALKHPIILDEVQKVPHILDEFIIDREQGLRFILCGSSARKLKRGQANLLAAEPGDLKHFCW